MKIIFLILLCSVSVFSQVPQDMRKRFGTLVSESYEIRPNILLTVTYGKQGEICRLNVKPQVGGDSKIPAPSSEMLMNLINELVPEKERGENIINGWLSSPDFAASVMDYEKLKIFSQASPGKEVNVLWKDKSCDNFPERKEWILDIPFSRR